jgi:CheY-like chemotaxis protein
MTTSAVDRPILLVVDDHGDTREMLSVLLGDMGFRIRTASSGREALSLARAEVPRLILLDLMMPDMDGVTFRNAQERDRTLADLPVLVISAHPDAASIADRLGAAGVLRKPVSIDDLSSTIRRLVGDL